MIEINVHHHFHTQGPLDLLQQLVNQGREILMNITDLQAKMDALSASNASLVLANTALQGDVTETLDLVNGLSIAAVVLKDAYDALKAAAVAGGTPAQIQALVAQADAVIAAQAGALAQAQAAKAALDAQDAALAALPGALTP
jgi:hypothetical protein